LLPSDETVAASVAARLKLPNRDSEKLRALAELANLLRGHLAPAPLRRILYQYGAENTRAALFLENVHVESLATITAWENPTFPLTGKDITKLGIPAGPRIGEILRDTEQWWIENDFRSDRAACLARAHQYVKNH